MDNSHLTHVKQITITNDLPAIYSFIKYKLRLSTYDKKSKDHPLVFCGAKTRSKKPLMGLSDIWIQAVIHETSISITKLFAIHCKVPTYGGKAIIFFIPINDNRTKIV